MMRRRTLSIALLTAIALVGAACGDDSPSVTGGADTTVKKSGAKVGVVYDIGGRGDQSFNDAAYAGLTKAEKELGVEGQDLEPTAGGADREEKLRLLTEQGFQLNFGIGFIFSDSIKKVAAEKPDLKFAIVDSVVSLPNVVSLTFAEEQGSYLVGAAAALKSKTGKLGFIGGVNTELIKKFEAGFIAGAKKINPAIQVEVKYITVPPDFSGFNDPAKGREIGNAMYANGADVIYAAAGGSGGGLFEAAKAASAKGTKVWAIGVDSDQINLVDASLKPFILTSMLKKVDVAVFSAIKDFVDGNFKAEVKVYDLKVGGVDYSTTGGNIDDIKDKLEDLKKQIVSGAITVPKTP